MKLNHININDINCRRKARPLAFLFAALFSSVLLSLSSCTDKTIDLEPDIDDPYIEGSADDMYYLGVRIYNAASIGDNTRASFDSDGDDYDFPDEPEDENDSHKKFNRGLAEENALFTNFTDPTDSPHMLLVFGEQVDGKDNLESTLQAILPLFDWDKEKYTHGSYPTVDNQYYTFYASTKKFEIPSNFSNRTVLIVLNASNKLKSDLKNALVSQSKYKDIQAMAIGDENSSDSDYLFYTDDRNPENIVKYFTMTSSIVSYKKEITTGETTTEVNYYGPALKRRYADMYKWYSSKEKAVEFPVFSFFVERTQSKYTLIFNCTDDQKKYYFGDTEYYEGTNYLPIENLVLTNGVDIKGDEQANDIEIQYVPSYTRSVYMSEINPVHVKKTKNFKINITGWDVNGIEKKEHLFKQLKDHSTNNSNYYGESLWNPISLREYRNFWAEGYNYKDGTYMDQYRNTYNHADIFSETNPNNPDHAQFKYIVPYYENIAQSSLIFFSYNDLSKRYIHQYSPENTIDPTANAYKTNKPVESNEILRKNTHIILTAQLLIGPTDGAKKGVNYDGLDAESVYEATKFDDNGLAVGTVEGHDVDAQCKLFMNNIYWSEAAYKAFVVEYLGYMMLSEDNRKIFGGTYYYDNEGNRYDKNEGGDKKAYTFTNDGVIYVSQVENAAEPGPATGSYFELGHIQMENGDNMVYVKPTASVHLYIKNSTYDPNLSEDDPISKAGLNKKYFEFKDHEIFEKLALQYREYFAQHFNAGRMYYAIPITHDANQISKQDIGLGKYGNVRNHWYRFTISSLRNIGTAVDLPDQPIVPNNLPYHDALGVEMDVLPWHTISTDVDISGQRPFVDPNQIDIDLYMKADDWNYQGSNKEL